MYISLPELNEIFRYVDGNLNWWGKLKFLWHKKRGAVKTMTGIVFGVAKEFQGKGIEGALIVYGEKYIVNKKLYKDTVLTWIGDFNPRMIKVCENLGAENYRTLATYRYLFDRSKPFKRHPVIEKKNRVDLVLRFGPDPYFCAPFKTDTGSRSRCGRSCSSAGRAQHF